MTVTHKQDTTIKPSKERNCRLAKHVRFKILSHQMFYKQLKVFIPLVWQLSGEKHKQTELLFVWNKNFPGSLSPSGT